MGGARTASGDHSHVFDGIPRRRSPCAASTRRAPSRDDSLQDAFPKGSDGVERQFEARSLASDWRMPYRLVRPNGAGALPIHAVHRVSERHVAPGPEIRTPEPCQSIHVGGPRLRLATDARSHAPPRHR